MIKEKEYFLNIMEELNYNLKKIIRNKGVEIFYCHFTQIDFLKRYNVQIKNHINFQKSINL
jgi:peroxiredoxin